MKYYIGVDIGGTNIKIGLVDEQGKALTHDSFSTDAQAGPQVVVDAIGQQVRSLVDKTSMTMDQFAGVGIGCPGPLDLKNGIVGAAPNLKTWKDVPLRDKVSQVTGLPAILENDANAAAFGEFWVGAGQDESVRNLVMVTLGTGIGCGIVDDGRLIHGKFGHAAEGGHMIVQPNGRLCACGQRGCIEAYASASNLARVTEEMLPDDPSSSLQAVFKKKGSLTSKDVFDHAKEGDQLALKVVDQTTDYLGVLCVNICRFLDPAMIVFAGGMILAGDLLFTRIRQAFARHTWTTLDDKVQIMPAELGNNAGFIGAAAVAWDGDRNNALVLAPAMDKKNG